MHTPFKRHIAVPQDHGSWIFILSPLFVGVLIGQSFSRGTLYLVIATMSAFMLRQPLAIYVKTISGRRPVTDRRPARFWMLVYAASAATATIALIYEGFGEILYLALPGLPVFAWHLWLVGRRAERNQPGIEIIATAVLSLAAPAAYWIGNRGYDPAGWWLWLLIWMQSAASIVYAYLRLEQRDPLAACSRSGPISWRGRALLFTSLNLAISLILGAVKLVPVLIFVPFAIQWLETLWGITRPSIHWKPVQIGMRLLAVSAVWTMLFIIVWRTSWIK